MQTLEITTDPGPGASLAQLELIVKGLRVATDVAYDAETRRVRRIATERMKFPTDDELRNALDRLSSEGVEESPIYRARRQLAAREAFSESRDFPPELSFDYWYRRRRGKDSLSQSLSQAGYDRITNTQFPVIGPVSLDVLDPILYDALVADEVGRLQPGRVGIRALRYGSPLWAWLFGKTTAEQTVSTTVKVLETARDYGPKRTIIKAEAEVAKATVDDKIADSALDVALKAEKLRQAQLNNDRLELENDRRSRAMDTEERRQILIERAIHDRQLDIADGIRALAPGDVQALSDLGRQPLAIEQRHEPDDADEEVDT